MIGRLNSGFSLLLIALCQAVSCSSVPDTEPSDTVPTTLPPPPTYPMVVETRTTGVNLDPDGYLVILDSVQQSMLKANDTRRFNGLHFGPHQVDLTGLTRACRVLLPDTSSTPHPGGEKWDDERIVEVADSSDHEVFEVGCFELGTLELLVTGNRYVEKFLVGVDHDPRTLTAVPAQRLTVADVSARMHHLWIRGVCRSGIFVGFTATEIDSIAVPANGLIGDTIEVGSQCGHWQIWP